MTDNHKRIPSFKPRSKRPMVGQDIVLRKQASQFPAVGMTLSSYSTGSTRAAAVPTPAVAIPMTNDKPKRRRKIFTLKRAVIVLALMVLLIGGWVGGKFLYNAHKVFGGNILNVLSSTKLKGEDSGRVNILLAGNSDDDVGHQGGDLTDSIMIMSIDTKNHTAFLISVPRDLWVDVPGSGHQKINAAYVDGESNSFSENGYPAGGMGQLEQVISENMGITINYYALVDYTAFRDAVNAVGGIDVNIQSQDLRGLYDPSIDYTTKGPLVKLTNGVHHLNGQQALDLARARGDAYGSYGFVQADFDRTSHQREMLVALKSKAVSVGVLSNPAKLSSLSDAVGNNVKTDFSLSEVHRLYDLVKDINGSNIKSLSLNSAAGKNLLANYTAPDGESALIPTAGLDNFNDIQAYLTQAMSSNPVVQEGAAVVLLNATDTSGIASRARNVLTAKQISVVTVGDATATQATTTIIDNSAGKFPATKALLLATYGNHFTTTNPYSGNYTADFIVLLGADQLPKPTTTNP